jgi:hypothetical protein
MYTTLHDITTADLQQKATHIHYFGLGFIQIKLGQTHRIHFYTDLLPAIVDKEDVHDHRYDFTSKILYGTFTQELFSVQEGNDYVLEEESCTEGYMPDESKRLLCTIEKISEEHFTTGSSYSISHTALHRVHSRDAITFLTRSPYKKHLARVARKQDAPKVCPFSKKVDEATLWNMVDTLLTQAQNNLLH